MVYCCTSSKTGKLGIWFFQFLTNRTHYVKIPGGISKGSPVLSCVPQGTVLGPLLFLIMISDINKGTTSSKLGSFAEGLVPNFLNQLFVLIQSAEEDHALFHM